MMERKNHMIWMPLIGFDRDQPDRGVGEYLENTGFIPKAMSVFIFHPDIINEHENMDKEFEIIKLSPRDTGLLKIVGEREVVVSVKVLNGSDEADNEWLMENIGNLYRQYYSRVKSYAEKEKK